MSRAVIVLLLRASVICFMCGSLAGVGLNLRARQALAPLKDRRFVRVSLLAAWGIGPVLAWLLLRVVPLEMPYATGLAMLALAPCAPFAPAMVERTGGDVGRAVAFLALSAVGTVLIMPLALPLLLERSLPAWTLARPLLMFVLLPMSAGMLMARHRPRLALRLDRPLARVTSGFGVLVLLLVIALFGRAAIGSVGSHAILAQVLFMGGSAAAAHLIAFGLPPRERAAVTVGAWSRNPGAALAPLAALHADPGAMVMIAIGVLLTVGLSPLLLRGLARGIRDAESA